MRKRSSYRPGKVLLNPVEHVLKGLQPLVALREPDQNLRLQMHTALEMLRTGKADRSSLTALIEAANMAEALAKVAKLGLEYMDQIQAAQQALINVCSRPRCIARGVELQAINLLVEVHEAQLDAATVAEIERSVDYIQKIKHAQQARKVPWTQFSA